MSRIKAFFSQLKIYVLWALLSVMLWMFVFGWITDTSVYKKVTLFADVPECREAELAAELEKDLPEGIKMVKVHLFSYAMFDESNITTADLFIIPDSHVDSYLSAYAPMEAPPAGEYYTSEGNILGVKVYDAASKTGAAAEYVGYPDEDCWLFLNKDGVHLDDGAALAVAGKLLELRG